VALPETLQNVILYFADPDKTREVMAAFRWPDGITCPRCTGTVVSFISTRNVWTCKACKKQFSIKLGTIFEDSPIALDKWLTALWMICNDKNGISSYEIGRALAVSQKSSWFMLHRLRLAMQAGSFEKKLCGEIEADETFVGGKIANMHAHKQAKIRAAGRKHGGVIGKTIVSGLLDRNTKKARVKVMANVRQYNIRTNITENVEQGSTVYSDALKSYRNLGTDGFVHEFIDHTETYVKGKVHTNGLENFWKFVQASPERNLRFGRTLPPASIRR
jgi:transposase-like protein